MVHHTVFKYKCCCRTLMFWYYDVSKLHGISALLFSLMPVQCTESWMQRTINVLLIHLPRLVKMKNNCTFLLNTGFVRQYMHICVYLPGVNLCLCMDHMHKEKKLSNRSIARMTTVSKNDFEVKQDKVKTHQLMFAC